MTPQDMFHDALRRVQALDLGDVVIKPSFDPLTDQGAIDLRVGLIKAHVVIVAGRAAYWAFHAPPSLRGGYSYAATTLLFATKLERQDARNHAAIVDAIYKIVEALA